MAVVPREQPATLLTVCEHGYGKRTPDLGLPDQEPRRQGRHHHQDHRAQRQGGRPAHRDRRGRPDADHRRRQADPHAGRRHPDHRPQHPGRAPHPPRGARRRSWRWSAWPRRKKGEHEVVARGRRRARRGADRWPRRTWARRPPPTRTRGRGRGATEDDDGRGAASEHRRGRATPRGGGDGRRSATEYDKRAHSAGLFERAPAAVPGRRELARAGLQGGGRHAGVPRTRRRAPTSSTSTATATSTSWARGGR